MCSWLLDLAGLITARRLTVARLWSIGLRALVGFMASYGAARERTNDTVMSGEVPGGSTNKGAFDAPFRLCWCARAKHEHQQPKSSQQSGHVILSEKAW
jgi:hypothetical protein